MATEVKILDVRSLPATEPGRAGKRDTLVIYTVAGGSARRVVIPKDVAGKADIERAIREQETAASSLIGTSFAL